MLKNWRNKIILAGVYVLTFVIALLITCFFENLGIWSGNKVADAVGFPSVYVNYNGKLVNEMTAYTVPVDVSGLRDHLTVVESNGALTFSIRENGQKIDTITYKVTNNANTYIVEEGKVHEGDTSGGYKEYGMTVKVPLKEGKEYCLTLTVTNKSGQEFYYNTRLLMGNEYRTMDKLNFMDMFFTYMFDESKGPVLSSYLSTSAINDNMTFTHIDIYSTANSVLWGNMNVAQNGAVATRIKEITKDAVTLQLLYKVQVYSDSRTYTEFNVKDYYTFLWMKDRFHLKDFKRSMNEIPRNNAFTVNEEGLLKLGITSEKTLNFVSGETDHGYGAAFVMDGKLWHYDAADNVVSLVIGQKDEYVSRDFMGDYPYGIKPLRIDEDGKVYFLVYGYMSVGNHEGNNGVALYVYDPHENVVEETAFIPSQRPWEMLKLDVERLSYMNEDHLLYLCLEDMVYRINYVSGQVRHVIEQLDIENYRLSDDGTMIAVPNATDASQVTHIDVYYMDNGDEKTIDGNGQILKLLGYFGNDILYGTADLSNVYVDNDGTQIVPMNKIFIADRDLTIIREYDAGSKFITGVKLDGNTVQMTMAEMTYKEGKKLFVETEGDYLVNNQVMETGDVSLVTIYDDIRRNETYIDCPLENKSNPISQTARMQEHRESVFEIDSPEARVSKYYVYTGDGLYGDFTSLSDAILGCDRPTATVIGENREIIWQKTGLQKEMSTDAKGIKKGEIITEITRMICGYAENNYDVSVNANMSILEALESNLTQHKVANLKGASLEDAFYFIYMNRPVIVMLRSGEYVVIVGYDEEYMQIADPTTGIVMDWNYKTYKKVFAEEGNVFLSYY